jgi:hypothetical protein
MKERLAELLIGRYEQKSRHRSGREACAKGKRCSQLVKEHLQQTGSPFLALVFWWSMCREINSDLPPSKFMPGFARTLKNAFRISLSLPTAITNDKDTCFGGGKESTPPLEATYRSVRAVEKKITGEKN